MPLENSPEWSTVRGGASRGLLPGCKATPKNLGGQKCCVGVRDSHFIHLLGSSWISYMGLGAGERGEKEEAWFLSTESFWSD